MSDVVIRHIDGKHVCGYTTDGRDFDRVGCEHDSPREASQHVDQLTGRRRRVDWREEPIQ